MAFFSQLLLLEVPRVSASISSTDKRIETRQPPLDRVRFFLSCHVNNSISRFAAIRLVFQYWVTFTCRNVHRIFSLSLSPSLSLSLSLSLPPSLPPSLSLSLVLTEISESLGPTSKTGDIHL